jgi:hypothetical protein
VSFFLRRSQASLALILAVSGCYQAHLLEGAPCVTDDECGVSAVDCADARCVFERCTFVPTPEGCPPGLTCDPIRGCVGGIDAPSPDTFGDTGIRPDAGPADASFDVLRSDVPFDTSVPDVGFIDTPLGPEVGPIDGGLDAPRDAPPFDTGRDVGPLDVGPVDGGRFDAGRDASLLDTGRDTPPGFDAGRDAGRDAGFDAGRDAGSDAGRDAGSDAGRDAGSDAGRPPTSMARRCTTSTVITIPDRPVLSTEVMTLELWALVRGPGVIARKGDVGNRRHLDIVVEGTGTSAVLRTSWGTGLLTQSVAAPFGDHIGVYTHIAIMIRPIPDGRQDLELWIDAVRIGAVTLPAPVFLAFNNTPLQLCSFDGDLDEVRFWGSPLEADVLEARRFGTISTTTGGLLAYWPIDGTGQIIFDRTLRGTDGVAGDFSTPDPRDPLGIPGGAF